MRSFFLALLGTIVCTTACSGPRSAAEDIQKRQDSSSKLGFIAQQVDMYMLRRGQPPATLAEVFTTEPVPQDAWGNEYVINLDVPSDKKYDVVSYGADGRAGGDASNADISWLEIRSRPASTNRL